jgi:hypothetical protein
VSPTPNGNGATPSPEPGNGLVSKTFPIHLSLIPEGAESVHVRVLLSTATGNRTVFDGHVNVSDIPFNVTVEGTGHAELIVFSVDENGVNRTQGASNINFSE